MTIKELKKILDKYPEDTKVIVDYRYFDYGDWEEDEVDIEEIYPLFYENCPEFNEIHIKIY